MESIDRLRDEIESARKSVNITSRVAKKLFDISDAIEQEAMADRTAAYNEGYDAGFASADDWAAQHEDAMAEHGWVRLPVDAEGVPIHVGDVMEWCQGGNVFTVAVLHLVSREWEVWGDDADYAPDECRHHHKPTVEDVLQEFSCMLMGKREFDGDVAEAISEYAAKLQLKED